MVPLQGRIGIRASFTMLVMEPVFAMKPISAFAGSTLHVVSTHDVGVLEVQAGGELVAKLAIRQLGYVYGSITCTAECDQGSWMFQRSGQLRRRIGVRAKDAHADLAEYKPGVWNPWNGKLKHADGRGHVVSCSADRLHVADDSGSKLFTIKSTWLVTPMAIELRLEAAHAPDLPWLVPFGAYLAVVRHMDTQQYF